MNDSIDHRTKPRRSFNPQFKIQIAEMVINGAATPSEVCEEYQISRSLVDRWVKQFPVNNSTKKEDLERENERLRAKIGELVMIIDQQKKEMESL